MLINNTKVMWINDMEEKSNEFELIDDGIKTKIVDPNACMFGCLRSDGVSMEGYMENGEMKFRPYEKDMDKMKPALKRIEDK